MRIPLLKVGLGSGQIGFRQPEVERCHQAAAVTRPHAFDARRIVFDGSFGQCRLPAGFDSGEPDFCRLGGDGKLYAAQVRLRGLPVGGGGQFPGTNPAPKIGFPTDIECCRGIRERGAQDISLSAGNREADEILLLACAGERSTNLWRQVRSSDASLRGGCLNPSGGSAKIVVLAERFLDGRTQAVITEVIPPCFLIGSRSRTGS